MKFCFGDIVVIEDNLIGVVVKDLCSLDNEISHEVYVRYFNEIRTYKEYQMERYMVRHKYLSDEEIMYQDNAINNRNDTTYYSIKQKNVLSATILDELVTLEYAPEFITKLDRKLKKHNVITINDLIKIEPQQLYNNYGLSKIQYTNLVLMLVCVCRKYSINSMYSSDDYYNVNKIDTKKRSSKNGK